MSGGSDVPVNYPELVLSGLGLATEFAVGIREIPDVPISIGKSIVARIGNSPLSKLLLKESKTASSF